MLLKDERRRIQEDLTAATKQLQEEASKNKQLNSQVERMTSLVGSLDSTKEELIKRLQHAEKDKLNEVSDKAVLS
jgi:uncharacterized coiled-coil DUF342 family protein